MSGRASASILMAVLLGLLVTASYAVLISLSSSDVNALGGTGLVDVHCPASPCQITRVSWTLTTSAPYLVDRVNIQWTTAKPSGATYMVYVVLYNDVGTVISSGSATQAASSSAVTTVVDVANVNPRDVYRVEVVIVEQ